MAFWKNLRVSTRLAMTFALVGMTCMGILGLSYMQQRQADAALTSLAQVEMAKLADVYELLALGNGTAPRIVAVNTSKDPEVHKAFGSQIKPRVERINAQMDKIKAWAVSEEERAWFKEFDGVGLSIRVALGRLEQARTAEDDATAQQVLGSDFLPAVQQYDEMLLKLVKMESARYHTKVDESKGKGHQRSHFFKAWIRKGVEDMQSAPR